MITRILLSFILLTPNFCYAKINIVASITPVASLVAMIAGDKADISVIAKSQDCPHHYSLKPSDLKVAKNADLFVYIDDDFDVFAKLLLPHSSARVLKISQIESLILAANNWHLWLLPKNAELILRSIEKSLSTLSPNDREFFKNNLEHSLAKIQALEKSRQDIMSATAKFVLLTDSAEYFFMNTEAIVQKLYQHSSYSSIKMPDRLKESDKSAKFVISLDQNLSQYKNLLGEDAKIIPLATENWENNKDLNNLYFIEFEKMLRAL